MHEGNDATTMIPAPSRDVLTEILRDGAQRLLGNAIEAEVADWIGRHAGLTDPCLRTRLPQLGGPLSRHAFAENTLVIRGRVLGNA